MHIRIAATLSVIPLLLAGCHNDCCQQVSRDSCCISGTPTAQSTEPVRSERVEARAARQSDPAGEAPQPVEGIDIRNLSRDRNIWIGGEPSSEGYRQIRERGVEAVVDLRSQTDKQQASADIAQELGMDYLSLPIDPKDMQPEQASLFLRFMREHQGKQVLIHCGSANRASGMYAVYLGAELGLPADKAIERARRTGLREAELERDVRAFLEGRQK
jgi:protein tyrosine phosphatase (PTP) superfamily phosphohydrolase (DUF442 family)